MSVTEIITLQTTDGDAFADVVGRMTTTLRAAEGCEGAAAGRCVERPGQFALVVDWVDVAAHKAFLETREFAEMHSAVDDLLAVEPEPFHYEMMR